MPNKAPLTIENFEFEKLRVKTPELKGVEFFLILRFSLNMMRGIQLLRLMETLEYSNM